MLADVSSVKRPTLEEVPLKRPAEYLPHHLDAFLSHHLSRLHFPSPLCPVPLAATAAGLSDEVVSSPPHAHPLFRVFKCAMEMGHNILQRKGVMNVSIGSNVASCVHCESVNESR